MSPLWYPSSEHRVTREGGGGGPKVPRTRVIFAELGVSSCCEHFRLEEEGCFKDPSRPESFWPTKDGGGGGGGGTL